MNVLVFASRKGGSGKSTLAAHLAAYIHKPTRPCLLVDADPQGSLTLWQALRRTGEPPLKAGTPGIAHRANFVLGLGEGEGAEEFAAESLASAEIARLWSAIDKSVKAIHGHGAAGGAMHKQAA